MKRFIGFTLIEVVISIFIFSSGMMAFMAYHARANTMIFETESSQTAHSLGLNLVEEINSMPPERFSKLADKAENTDLTYGAIYKDSFFKSYFNEGGSFASSPFNSWGKPLDVGESTPYMFYRFVIINTYGSMSDTSFPETSQFNRLRHVEIITSWPKKGYGNTKCESLNNTNECNYISVPLVKFVDIETP